MIFVFYFFAATLVLLSFKSFRGGCAYLRFFRSELEKPLSGYTPFVSVIAPCRGLDPGLNENLRSLLAQDYPAYEIIFVVDDTTDPAVAVIDEVRGAASESLKTRLVVARKATGCSQKVENLLEAVGHASDMSRAFVFVDSDVRPSAGWLRHLVAPLQDPAVGAATGYRWFISRRRSFASELRSAWNASIASALGPNTTSNFCWGGSLAISREVFEGVDMRERWLGTLSDDFAVTRALNEGGLPIVFVPRAMAASVESCTFREMLEFTTRQMKITRVYAPKLWVMSFIGSALFNGVLIAALLIAVFARQNTFALAAATVTLVLVTVFSVGKAWLRLKAVKLVLRGYPAELGHQFWTQNTLWLLAPSIFFYNSLAAWVSRRLTWRGIRYELKSPTETVIITD